MCQDADDKVKPLCKTLLSSVTGVLNKKCKDQRKHFVGFTINIQKGNKCGGACCEKFVALLNQFSTRPAYRVSYFFHYRSNVVATLISHELSGRVYTKSVLERYHCQRGALHLETCDKGIHSLKYVPHHCKYSTLI